MSSARMGSEAAVPGQGNNRTHADTHMCEALTVPRDLGPSTAQPRPGISCLPSPLHGLPERLPWEEPGGAGLSRGRSRRRTSAAPGPGKGPTGPSDSARFDLRRCCCSPQRAAIAPPPRDRPCSKLPSLCITGFCPPASRCSQHTCPEHLDIHPFTSPFPAQNTPSAPSPASPGRGAAHPRSIRAGLPLTRPYLPGLGPAVPLPLLPAVSPAAAGSPGKHFPPHHRR